MEPMSFGARLGFAVVAFFRVLFDGSFAARAFAVRDAMPTPAALPAPAAPVERPPSREATNEARMEGALTLLGVLQRDGRLVDFLMQDVAAFTDDEIGAAARVVHDGTAKALRGMAEIAAIYKDVEGARVSVAHVDASVKLTGNVAGSGPYAGALRHKGWRCAKLSLPDATREFDATVLAPAEVEL